MADTLEQNVGLGAWVLHRVGQSVVSALIALALLLIAHISTIFDKKYRILTRRDKRESYSIVLQQNNV